MHPMERLQCHPAPVAALQKTPRWCTEVAEEIRRWPWHEVDSRVSCIVFTHQQWNFHESEECFEPLEGAIANDIAVWRGSFDFQTSTESVMDSETAAVSEDPRRTLH